MRAMGATLLIISMICLHPLLLLTFGTQPVNAAGVATTLRLDQPQSSVPEGENITFTGRLTRNDTGVGVAYVIIKIYDDDLIGDDLMASGTTGDNGHFSITWTAVPMDPTNREVDAYAKFEGTDQFESSQTLVYHFNVAEKVSTTLSLDALPSSVVEGDEVTFTGRLTRDDTGAGVSGTTIRIYEYDPYPDISPSDLMASGTTDNEGYFSITWTAEIFGPFYDDASDYDLEFEVYAKFGGTDQFESSQTSVRNLNIGQREKVSTTLSLDVLPSGIVEGDIIAFTGRLTRNDTGAGVANATIEIYDSDIDTDDLMASGTTDNGYFLITWTAVPMDPTNREVDAYAKFEGTAQFESSQTSVRHINVSERMSTIKRPRYALPQISCKGSSFDAILERAVVYTLQTEEWNVEISTEYDSYSLNVNSVIRKGTEYTLNLEIPADVRPDLYDLTIEVNGISETQPNSLQVIQSFPEQFSFIQLTDSHIRTESDPEFHEVVEGIISEINLIHPEFVLLTGDIGDWSDEDIYRNWQRISCQLNVPVFTIMGNHDERGGGYWPVLDAFPWWDYEGGRELFRKYVNLYDYYSFDFGEFHFTGITSYETVGEIDKLASGELTDETLDWLEEDLFAHMSSKQRFVFLHHPCQYLVDYGDEKLINLCDNYDVSMVLAGHTHIDKVSRRIFTLDDYRLGTIFLETRSSKTSDAPEVGYRLIKVNGENIESYTYDFDGDGFRDANSSIPYGNLNVTYHPSNAGRFSEVTAVITNELREHFEDGFLEFRMPRSGEEYDYICENGTITQRIVTENMEILYVSVDIEPESEIMVKVLPDRPNIHVLPTSLSLTPDNFVVGEESSITLTATLTSNGVPVANKNITFSVPSLTGAISPITVTSNSQGEVSTTYTAPSISADEASVTINANFFGDWDYEGNSASTSGIIEIEPTVATISVEGAAFQIPGITGEIFSYWEYVPEWALNLLPIQLLSKSFLLATEDSIYLVLSTQSDKGIATVEGWTLPNSITLGGVSLNVIIADNVFFDKTGEPASVEDILSNPEEYRLDLVKVSATRRHISVLFEVENILEVPLTVGYLVEDPESAANLVRKSIRTGRNLIENPSISYVRSLLQTEESHLGVFGFETDYWIDCPAETNGIVLTSGSILNMLKKIIPETAEFIQLEDDIPVLYNVKSELNYQNVSSVREITQNPSEYRNEIVGLTVNEFGVRISIQETIKELTGILVPVDVCLEGTVNWNDLSIPPRMDEILFATGASSESQDAPVSSIQGRFTLVGRIVTTKQIDESLPEKPILLIYDREKESDIEWEGLANETRTLIENELGKLNWTLSGFTSEEIPGLSVNIPEGVNIMDTPGDFPENVSVGNKIELFVKSVNPETPIELKMENSEVSTIRVNFASIYENVGISFEKIEKEDLGVPEPPGYTYFYSEIRVRVPKESVESAEITFRVLKGWLEAQNVGKEDIKLLRYHGGSWDNLPTTLESETQTHFQYSAETPGFSIFAITAVVGGGEPQPEPPSEGGLEGIAPVLVGVAVVAIIIVIAALTARWRKKP